MSFGSAARPGRVRPDEGAECPCGSGRTFGGCCDPVLRGEPATSAEALMRSRFTAFALGDARHLVATWHPRTRPDDLSPDPMTAWERLEVLDAEGDGEDETGTVEFRAHWRERGRRGVLHERSRFGRVRGRWVYIDGETPDG